MHVFLAYGLCIYTEQSIDLDRSPVDNNDLIGLNSIEGSLHHQIEPGGVFALHRYIHKGGTDWMREKSVREWIKGKAWVNNQEGKQRIWITMEGIHPPIRNRSFHFMHIIISITYLSGFVSPHLPKDILARIEVLAGGHTAEPLFAARRPVVE